MDAHKAIITNIFNNSTLIPLANMRQNGPLFLKKMMMQNPIGIQRLKLVE